MFLNIFQYIEWLCYTDDGTETEMDLIQALLVGASAAFGLYLITLVAEVVKSYWPWRSSGDNRGSWRKGATSENGSTAAASGGIMIVSVQGLLVGCALAAFGAALLLQYYHIDDVESDIDVTVTSINATMHSRLDVINNTYAAEVQSFTETTASTVALTNLLSSTCHICTSLNEGPYFQCWDLNQDGNCTLPTEDKNSDGICNALDCVAQDGQACWDLDNDRVCDLLTEDTNGDGLCNVYDCHTTYLVNSTDSTNLTRFHGIHCWDLNQNRLCDPIEDVNGDGNCTVLDCRSYTNGTIELYNEAGPTIDMRTILDSDYDVRLKDEYTGLSIYTGGENTPGRAMHISSAGHVAVGAHYPSYPVHIVDDSGGYNQIRVHSNSSTGKAGISLYQTTAVSDLKLQHNVGGSGLLHNTGGNLTIMADSLHLFSNDNPSTEAIHIASNGYIGFGTRHSGLAEPYLFGGTVRAPSIKSDSWVVTSQLTSATRDLHDGVTHYTHEFTSDFFAINENYHIARGFAWRGYDGVNTYDMIVVRAGHNATGARGLVDINARMDLMARAYHIAFSHIDFDSHPTTPVQMSPSAQPGLTWSIGFGFLYPENTQYADIIHLNTWENNGGGYVNLIAVKKTDIGMRIFQGDHGSTTAYGSRYADVAMIGSDGRMVIRHPSQTAGNEYGVLSYTSDGNIVIADAKPAASVHVQVTTTGGSTFSGLVVDEGFNRMYRPIRLHATANSSFEGEIRMSDDQHLDIINDEALKYIRLWARQDGVTSVLAFQVWHGSIDVFRPMYLYGNGNQAVLFGESSGVFQVRSQIANSKVILSAHDSGNNAVNSLAASATKVEAIQYFVAQGALFATNPSYLRDGTMIYDAGGMSASYRFKNGNHMFTIQKPSASSGAVDADNIVTTANAATWSDMLVLDPNGLPTGNAATSTTAKLRTTDILEMPTLTKTGRSNPNGGIKQLFFDADNSNKLTSRDSSGTTEVYEAAPVDGPWLNFSIFTPDGWGPYNGKLTIKGRKLANGMVVVNGGVQRLGAGDPTGLFTLTWDTPTELMPASGSIAVPWVGMEVSTRTACSIGVSGSGQVQGKCPNAGANQYILVSAMYFPEAVDTG